MYISSASAEKRRYARAVNRVLSGVWGRDICKFREVTLTTREGDDNTWDRMKKDIQKLKKQLERRGIVIDYCLSPELTPNKKLLHLHGFLFFRKGMLELYELQAMWKDIHGASQVHYKEVKSYLSLCKYMVKHMLKEYADEIGFKGKMLMSMRWLPLGWQECRKALVKWAMDRAVAWGSRVWQAMNDLYKEWCFGRTIMIVLFRQKIYLRRVRREEV